MSSHTHRVVKPTSTSILASLDHRQTPTRTIRAVTAIGWCCLLPLSGFAGASSSPATEPSRIDPVEVTGKRESTGAGSLNLDSQSETASRLGLSGREMPASVDVISRETLLARGQYNLREAVQSAVGMSYIGTGGNGSSALSLRGFTGHSSVVQMLDGTRMQVGSGTSTLVADTTAFERIEVLRGPASVLFGDSAIGGAINYVAKQPSFSTRRDALVSYGANNTSQLSVGGSGGLSERVAYRADLSRQASSGYVDRASYTRVTFSGALLFQIKRDLSFTLALNTLRNDDAPYWGTPLVTGEIDPSLRRNNYNVDDSKIRYEDDFVRLKADWRPTTDWSIKNELYHYESNRHWRNLENYVFQAPRTVRRTGYLEILHDFQQTGNRIEALWDGSSKALPVRLIAGAEFNRITFKNTNNSPFTGTTDVPLTDFSPGRFVNVAGTRLGANSVTEQEAAFVEAMYTPLNKVTLVAGVRKERQEIDGRNAQTNLQTQKTFSPLTWRLGAVARITPAVSLYGQYSTAVDPVAGLLTLSPANSAFDLARGKQAEVGLKQSFAQGLGDWTLALYQIKKTNILSRDPVNPTLTQQVGAQSARGIELAVALRPLAGWQVEGNVSVLKARFDRFDEMASGVAVSRAGNLPPNVPKQVTNLWVTKEVNENWRAGLGLRKVGPRFANNANTLTLAGYETADAYVAWSRKTLNVTLRGRNLTNKLYAITPYNGGTQMYLSEPRSAEIAVRYQF